ncbi:nuclear transport factor 2 family protein [Persicitalea jodogahamensis]|nr:nuclear transport factor 2 family protein [Persicitalea jodogahamensis]
MIIKRRLNLQKAYHACLGAVLAVDSTVTLAQKMDNEMETEIKQAVAIFDQATARRDIETLKSVLHPDYRVTANRFRGTPGTTLITRETYLEMMKDGKIGGTKYEEEFRQISVTGHTAMVDVMLREIGVPAMHKYLFLVQNEKDDWQIISDLPIVIK